ncbi:MAG: purine-nucleoside phosphorylase [Firmicutes bacterium]|nr:purine-nucleoside phosphorylase [Bacillota bacterium]
MATPHIEAAAGDFAKTVLMPGDPLRSKFIAESFLTGARLINNVRGIQGYTGEYKGQPVSVMASGMGMPSIGIYSYELFKLYNVDNIIRIGSAGALSDKLDLFDIVAGAGTCTNSNYQKQYNLPGTYAPIADYGLLSAFVGECERQGERVYVGNLLSSDTFYDAREDANERWRKMGVLAVEMEAAALYMNAAYLNKRALAVCTISDCPMKGTETTSAERERSFVKMIELALDTAAKL